MRHGQRLIVVGRESLSFREPVAVSADVPEQMDLRRIAEPLDAISQDRDRRVVDRRAFLRPPA